MSIILKPWGFEEIFSHTDKYVGKILHIRAGEMLSRQYHQQKDETIRVLIGTMKLELGEKGEEAIVMQPGSTYHITPGTIHRMIAITACDVLEVSTPELDDVVRLEDKYNRA